MTTAELLTHLRKLKVALSADNGQLIFNGPKGALTQSLRAELSGRKAEILELLKKAGAAGATPAESNLRRVSRDKELPLSFAQQRLWFLAQLEPGNAVYNVPGALRIRGRLDARVLQQSLEEIVRRHEALRTTFSVVEGEPVQVIAPSLSFPLPAVDISRFSASEREEEALRLATKDAKKPFDLGHGPLFRSTLIRLEERDHVLLLTMHHIVSDGWSTGVLYRELSVLYRAFANAEASPLPDLPIQYADFAAWQRERLQGEVLESQLSYWKKQLKGAPVVLNLPTDRPRPAVQSFRGARQSVEFSAELTNGLKTLSRKEGVTLYMTLLAAFQTLLHRYTGQDDIVVGSPIANRNRIEIEGLIGFFVNTLVLRTDHQGNPTFRELLQRVRETALEAYAHQDLPFEKLVEELRPDRSLGRSPLFQVMFVFQNAPASEVRFEGLTVSPFRVAGETAKFDLTLTMNETPSGLRAGLQYRIDLFDEATMKRMLGHFQTLLKGIVAVPERCISELPILTEAEKHQLLVEWNETKRDYPREKCLHDLFEEQVRRSPEAVAVVCEDRQLTYRELNERANQLAHYLQRSGIGPEVLVGICVERSIEMVVGILGILKAGGAYLPLDPSYPKERFGLILEDARVGVLLTQEKLIPETIPSAVVCLDRDWQQIARESVSNPNSGVMAENLAYVLYTSGSTGKPKGVMIQHRSVINLFTALKECVYADERTPLHVSLNASIAFDSSVKQLVQLLNGHALYIVPDECRADGQALLDFISRQKLDVLDCTPAQARLLVEAGMTTSGEHRVKLMLVGGEAIDKPLWMELCKAQRTRAFNVYGPTECTVDSTVCQIQDGIDIPVIGRPIANVQVYILDSHNQPVPIGIPGEMHIGGNCLARGYLNRPELTNEKFITNPFSADLTSRLYKTGDLARYLPDGNIEFLGRVDNQVKIRGYRIELGEIEAALNQDLQLREAIVIAREDTPGDKRLVAYVAADDELAMEELRSRLRAVLPNYMVPGAFVRLQSFPLTSNGKIDRAALPAPDANRSDLTETYAAPRTSIEELLTKIWAQVLKLDKVGIHDNFFNLGGHSLLATQAMSRMREALRQNIPLRNLFEAPTVSELALLIEQSGARHDAVHAPAIERAARDAYRVKVEK